MLRQAFNAVTRLHSRPATLKRLGASIQQSAIRITPSNFFRFQEAPSDLVIRGREFIIPIDSIASKFSPLILRGDRIVDVEIGSLAIDEVIEMYDLGGKIMGYRVRCD